MAGRGRVKAVIDFRDVDKGWKRMQQLARQAEGSTVKVGVLAGTPKELRENEPTGITNVQLAAIHEYGSPARNIPERSFLRATVDANRGAYNGLIAQMTGLIFDGKLTVGRALSLLGLKVVADVRARIRKGISPALADSTLRRKLAKGGPGRGKRNRGKSVPLIDTGQLINSITHVVELKSGKRTKGGGP
jgi:hypothetical protein